MWCARHYVKCLCSDLFQLSQHHAVEMIITLFCRMEKMRFKEEERESSRQLVSAYNAGEKSSCDVGYITPTHIKIFLTLPGTKQIG